MIKHFETFVWLLFVIGVLFIEKFVDVPIIKQHFEEIIIGILGFFIIQLIRVKKAIDKNAEDNSISKRELLNQIKTSFGGSLRNFNNSEEIISYFELKLNDSKHVLETTWAPFSDVHSPTDNNFKSGLTQNKIKKVYSAAKKQVSTYEIFIFNEGKKYKKERLEKLKYNYLLAKAGKNTKYSCGYYSNMEFPRIQFSIIDEKELIFSSTNNTRCSVEDKVLANIFSNYWQASWEKATRLIDNGYIVEEDIILELIAHIDK